MKPFRTPGDVAKPIKEYFTSTLPPLVLGTDPTVALNVPTDWTAGVSPPHIGVFDDGGPGHWPVSTTPTTRVTVWSDGRDTSRTIAGICMAILLSHRIPGIATVTDPTSIIEDRDPDNGGLMASFTVTAQVRTNAA